MDERGGEAAEYLNASVSRFYEAAARGDFGRYKDICKDVYHRDELDEWRRRRA